MTLNREAASRKSCEKNHAAIPFDASRCWSCWLGSPSGAQALLRDKPPAPQDPHIGYVFPAGGQRGTAIEVVVGGQFLDGTNDVLVSGGNGVRATVIKINKPFPRKRFTELRDYLEQARKKLLEAGMQPKRAADSAHQLPQPNHTTGAAAGSITQA